MLRTLLLLLIPALAVAQDVAKWGEGYLDIHHINTGSGNSTFFIFPDGTTMLLDAGDVERSPEARRGNPLKIAPPIDSTPALGILKYIKRVMPGIDRIDYVVVSHFHNDHYGALPELATYIPIGTLIDRGYPDYTYPVDLIKNSFDPKGLAKYLELPKKIKTERLIAGRNDQVRMIKNHSVATNFHIRNIKSAQEIWTGSGESSKKILPDQIAKEEYNENPLSLALKISYGNFDYFTGGDLTGLVGFGLPTWFDVETPLAPIVGPVDAMSLNHHGLRDAMNATFLRALAPRVIVQQSWSSNHPGEEVLHRIISKTSFEGPRDIFATYVHEETKVTYGRWLTDNYRSTNGHILIRVMPGGEKFSVFVGAQQWGPFQSK